MGNKSHDYHKLKLICNDFSSVSVFDKRLSNKLKIVRLSLPALSGLVKV